MRRAPTARNFGLLALIVVLFIVYGSLYPFAFHHMPPSAVEMLLSGWRRRPGGGDAVANVLLYMPLGYFGAMAMGGRARWRVVLVLLFGMALSVSMELLQYWDSGRDTSASDVYTNAAGTALGIAVALILGNIWKKLPRGLTGDPAVLLLLAAWAGYNLFPFVPVIDLHKYWHAIKPLLHPVIAWYPLFNHIAVWAAAAAMFGELIGGWRAGVWFTAFAAALVGGKIFIADGTLNFAEIAAPPLALCLLLGLKNRAMINVSALLLFCSIVALRLEPFRFQTGAGQFGWIPFLSFIRSSVGVDTLSFLEKSFLYGGLIWLLEKAGWRLSFATLGVAAILFATSLAEIYLPGRSAEITDAAMALCIGAVIALVRQATPGTKRAAAG